MHAQQNVSFRFAHRMDAAGTRQSSVSTNNVSWLRPISIQSLTALVIGNFNPQQATVGWIIDDMHTPIGPYTSRDAQHGSVVDPKLWSGGSFSFESLRQQMCQYPLQQRRSFAQTVEDRGVFQLQSRLAGPSRRASQREIFHGIC
jgi:hypothetical protein